MCRVKKVNIYLTTVFLIFCLSFSAFAKNVKYRKTQDVSFEGSNVDGLVKKPTGSFVVQKRGVDFVPLYKVRQKFDSNILESVEYLR